MRIIAGRFRSRKLQTPPDALTTRPIPDRVKESVFGILRGHFEDAVVLDAFAGTGSIGLEALSRGASRVVFFERDRRAADMLQKNIDSLGAQDECELVRSDALGPALLNRCPKPVNLAFFDPPYPLVLDPESWPRVQRQLERVVEFLDPSGYLILRTPWPFRHAEAVLPDGSTQPVKPAPTGGRPRVPTLGDLQPPHRKGRHDRDGHADADAPRAWEGANLSADEIEAEHARELADLERAALESLEDQPLPVVRHDVDLTLAGAIGPETHPYASTAVHLYMRRKAP